MKHTMIFNMMLLNSVTLRYITMEIHHYLISFHEYNRKWHKSPEMKMCLVYLNLKRDETYIYILRE